MRFFECRLCEHFKQFSQQELFDSDGLCLIHGLYVDELDSCVDECRSSIYDYYKERRE